MADARDFCRVVMHEYERQWSRATGHQLRHPLRLKIERLQNWCDRSDDPADFEAELREALASDDPGTALLAEELLPLWQKVRQGQPLHFPD